MLVAVWVDVNKASYGSFYVSVASGGRYITERGEYIKAEDIRIIADTDDIGDDKVRDEDY